MRARAHVLISGRVQGVCFRADTRDTALGLGVRGWVKNRSDGKVEALFEGEKEDVEQMIGSCKSGPPGAAVDDVDVQWEEYKGEFGSFEIRW